MRERPNDESRMSNEARMTKSEAPNEAVRRRPQAAGLAALGRRDRALLNPEPLGLSSTLRLSLMLRPEGSLSKAEPFLSRPACSG